MHFQATSVKKHLARSGPQHLGGKRQPCFPSLPAARPFCSLVLVPRLVRPPCAECVPSCAGYIGHIWVKSPNDFLCTGIPCFNVSVRYRTRGGRKWLDPILCNLAVITVLKKWNFDSEQGSSPAGTVGGLQAGTQLARPSARVAVGRVGKIVHRDFLFL